MKDTVAIFGDVHGQDKMLVRLIEKIHGEAGYDVDLYSLGDVIDRGPDPCAVIDLCIKHKVKGIIGNHEIWLRDLVRDQVFDQFALESVMGGEATFLSYNVFRLKDKKAAAMELLGQVPEDHRDYLEALPDYRVINVDGHKYWLIHAGLTAPNAMAWKPRTPGATDEMMMESIVKSGRVSDVLHWPRPGLPSKMYPKHNMFKFEDATQVLGHRPVGIPLITKSFIAIDTGCGTCSPKTLTAILLPSKKIIQVKEDD